MNLPFNLQKAMKCHESREIDRNLRACLDTAQIGLEVMSTPSACRTYNVLLTEGRRVAACLLAL